ANGRDPSFEHDGPAQCSVSFRRRADRDLRWPRDLTAGPGEPAGWLGSGSTSAASARRHSHHAANSASAAEGATARHETLPSAKPTLAMHMGAPYPDARFSAAAALTE